MTKSSVVDNETGKSMDSTVRTSTGTFFARGQDEVLASVEKRIAQVCCTCLSMLMSSQEGSKLQFAHMCSHPAIRECVTHFDTALMHRCSPVFSQLSCAFLHTKALSASLLESKELNVMKVTG